MLARPSVLTFALVAAAAGFAVAAFAPQIFNDGDTWWHLAAGGWMLAHHAVPRHDIFSFTFAGRPWNAQEWLAEILMALAFRADGWQGLHLLFGMAMAFTAAIVAGGARARTAPLPALLASLLGLASISGSLLARPHLLALPLLALWTLMLLDARDRDRAPPLWLAALMLLWVNLHGSFAFGLALASFFALEAVLSRRSAMRSWALFLGLSLLAALVNPQGLNGLLFPVRLLGMGGLRAIGEWAPERLTRLTPFAVAIMAIAAAGLSGRLKLAPLRAALLLGLIWLGLSHVRHQMLFGVVAPLLVAPALAGDESARDAPRWLPRLAAGLVLLPIVLRLLLPVSRGADRVTPMAALDHVPPALRARPVLNAYDFGGYLIWRGVRVFVDGRTDMYPDGFLARYDRAMRPDREALSDALARWRIAWTILPPGPVSAMVAQTPGWRRIYADRFAVVDVKD